jgi:hypothetical protein
MIKSIHSQTCLACQSLIPQAQVQLPRLVSEQIVASGFGTADSEITNLFNGGSEFLAAVSHAWDRPEFT